MTADWELIQQYVRRGAEDAFAELTRRHLNLVYSVALRQTRSPHLAEEIAQSVFADLAAGAANLKEGVILTAWLYRVARHTAVDVVRRESRRQAREREAMMDASLPDSGGANWAQMEGELENAMDALDEADRTVILLRFFENRSLREVGDALGSSDDAAQKRVSRAVDRLREVFLKRDIRIGAAALGAALSANAALAAPSGLAAAIAATLPASASALISVVAMTAIQKTSAFVLFAAAIGAALFQTYQAARWRQNADIAASELAASWDYASGYWQRQKRMGERLAALEAENEKLRAQAREVHYLRAEAARRTQEQQAVDGPGAAETNLTAAMISWLGRVQQLRAKIAERPDLSIPEFRYLEEEDWLSAARIEMGSEEDYHKAISQLRMTAENKVAARLQPALQNFVRETGREFPARLSDLQEHMEPKIDEDVLQRYVILPAEEMPDLGLGGKWIITQRSIVDEERDLRMGVGPYGHGRTKLRPNTAAVTDAAGEESVF